MRPLLCGVLLLSGCFDWEVLSDRFGADGSVIDNPSSDLAPVDQALVDQAPVDLPRTPFIHERMADNGPLNAIRGNDAANIVYAVGNGGRILRYNAGTWASVNSGVTSNLRDVWIQSTDVVVVGEGQTALVDRGAGFISDALNVNKSPFALWATPEGGLLAIGDGGGGGKAWIKQTTGWAEQDRTTGEFMYGLWGLNKTFFAVGTNSAALHITSDRAGALFTSQKFNLSPGGTTFRAVWGTTAADIWAVGDGGTINHWDGTAWARSSPTGLPTMALRGIWGTSASNIYAVGDAGTTLHYDGTRWSPANLDLSTTGNLNDVWGAPDGSRFWIVTSLGEIFRSP